jgi:hypothetical protein
MSKDELCFQHAEKLGKISEDITEIRVDVGKINVTLDFQQKILAEHMKRTELSEQRLQKLELPYKLLAYLIAPIGVIASIVATLSYLHIL